MNKKTMVLGFPRSGTGTMAKVLGLGHEKINENGTSDWHMVFNEFKRDDWKIIHVIRNPIDVISSNIFTMKNSSLQLIKKYACIEDMSILSTIIKGFIKWNMAIEKLCPDEVIFIEDVEDIYNKRIHPKMKWSDLDGVPEKLKNEFKELAIKYGYDPNDK